ILLKTEGKGVEEAARQARYQVFERVVSEGGCLLQGHHRDDQAETVLLRLFRGTGLEGLQAMPAVRRLGTGLLFRPLLSLPRSAIEACARRYELSFIEDNSNRDERFSRNYLRCSLIPEVERRWPGVAGRLTELASEVEEVNDHHRLQLDTLVKSTVVYRPGWLLGQQPLLAISELVQLGYPMQKQVVRHWLKSQGWMVPSRDALTRVFDQVVSARGDAEPCLNIGDYSIRRFRGLLIATGALSLEAFEPFLWNWQKSPGVQLGERQLHWVSADEGNGSSVHLPPRPLMVRRRCHAGQEKIAIAGRTGRKTLKRWLQEYRVPPWLREFLPLIYDGERMVAAPGLWVCEGYQGAEAKVVVRLGWSVAAQVV
ncbi:MAG: tRNA lysidine(34) synthetase TilS, partial [Endozoicomonas sp.]